MPSLDSFLKRFKQPDEYRPKVIKIIEMSKEGRTLEEIRDTVKMSNGNVNSARRWGRQAGLW
jgi:hypothetical protein